MVSRRRLKGIARLALAAFLFTQAVLAMAACELDRHSPAQALLTASAADGDSCHHEADESSTNALCVAHCVTSTQTVEKPLWKSPVPAASPFAVLLLIAPSAAPAPVFDLTLPVIGPPRRILFRTLLI